MVYEQASKQSFAEVYIAAADDEIEEAASEFTDKIISTEGSRNGSEAVWIANQQIKANIIINYQGDLVGLKPDDLQRVYEQFIYNLNVKSVYTAHYYCEVEENPSSVKSALTNDGRALYYSRSNVPWGTDKHAIHSGIYIFWRKALDDIFWGLKGRPIIFPTKCEKLEQNYFLEKGFEIYSVEIAPTISVDTEKDYRRALDILGF